MAKSIVDMLVTSAVRLKDAFKVNGKSTDGTTNIEIEAIKSVTRLALKPSEVITFSTNNSEGMSSYLVDGRNILPSVFAATHLCNLILQDNRDPAQTDGLTGLLISRSNGKIYHLTAARNASSWTLLSTIADNRDLKSLKEGGSDKLTTARKIAISGDAAGDKDFDGSTDIDIALTLADIFKNKVTLGTADPDTTTLHLITTKHANAPNATDDWAILTFFNAASKMQLAITGNGAATKSYVRHSFNNSWRPWVPINNSGLVANDIPNISANKITSGTLHVDRIPELSADKITSGTLHADRIPNLNANKINAGTFDEARIPNIPAERVVGGVFKEAQIPALPASRIGSGAFHVDRIPNVPATKVNSGVFDQARIPDIPAERVVGGIFQPGQIPSIDASKVISGIFDTDRIPALDASKVNGGVFNSARIPNLDAAKITAGAFGIDRIPSLPASKTTSGTFDVARIPNLTMAKVTNLGNAAGRDIYVSTAAPDNSIGKDGDIWFQI